MIIDGHAHLGGEYRDLSSIIATLDDSGVDKVILCPADQRRKDSFRIPDFAGRLPAKELNFIVNRLLRFVTSRTVLEKNLGKGNEEVFNVCSLSKGRVIQFFWANPRKKGIADELESKFELWNYKGIKLHQACHPFNLNSVHFRVVAEFAVQKKIPIFIHLYSKREVEKFINVSKEFDINFILGHLIGLEIFVKLKDRIGRNVFFDISCPPLVSQNRVKLAIKEFGAERVITGSDIPYGKNNLQKVIEEVKSLGLSKTDTDLILGNNLKNILFL